MPSTKRGIGIYRLLKSTAPCKSRTNFDIQTKFNSVSTLFSTEFLKELADDIEVLLSCQPRVKVTSCVVYNIIRDLESIDHLCIYPILRIELIHKCYIDSRKLKWSVQVNILINNCKHNMTSLLLLADRTVV